MKVKSFLIAIIILPLIFLFAGCDALDIADLGHDEDTSNESILDEEISEGMEENLDESADEGIDESTNQNVYTGGLAAYQAAIENNLNIFEVSLVPQAQSTRVDIKNISNTTYYWILLNVVLADANGTAVKTIQAGVYSNLAPQAAMSYYLFGDSGALTQGYVTGFKDNYFNK